MEILYTDKDIVVCVKPPRVLSTDEPGGVPELARQALGDPAADIRTVHRLDRVVGGLMVLARSPAAAAELSRQIREGTFGKEYLAVIHGTPEKSSGILIDLMYRDKARKMSFVTDTPRRGAQEAALAYRVEGRGQGLSLVRIRLITGRTHQIRVQFASRGMPLVGERKYAQGADECEIALWSHRLTFRQPATGRELNFSLAPPHEYPWTAV